MALDATRPSRQKEVVAVIIHSASEIERLRRAGKVAAATLAHVGARIVPAVPTARIDRWVREDTKKRGGRPSQLGYRSHGSPPFPAAVCTSINEVVCHGIPNEEDILEPGDIVNVDVTTEIDGFHGDTSATFIVGGIEAASVDARHVVDVARRARCGHRRRPRRRTARRHRRGDRRARAA